MTGYRIRNLSGIPNIQCFVSSYNGGNDEWYTLPTDYCDPHKCHWSRSNWEMVVFKNPANGERRGWYLNSAQQTLELTFVGFSQELGIVRNAA
ncbi:hypothetical protein VNI00_004500 [Paramarasmius palmivorus]|uniref:Uncharacterized protein n=1 Tax=Paramarasmius palmivorus TaxID=297713 RepID=A0AAW0DFB1_9AGAR